MADTKISALAAAFASTDTIQIAVNDAGTSKSLSGLLLKTYANTAPVWAAGTSSANTWPKMTTGSLLTTAEAGAYEFANGCLHWTPNASNRGTVLVEHWIRQAADRNLTNSVAEQAAFDSVAGGTLTLPTGVYFFECVLYVTGMSITTGNFAFDLKAAGTVTLANIIYRAFGIDATNPTVAFNTTGTWTFTQQSATSILTSAVGAAIAVEIRGTFEVTVAGTIVPSISLVTASAAVLKAGSYFKCNRVGAPSATAVGNWS